MEAGAWKNIKPYSYGEIYDRIQEMEVEVSDLFVFLYEFHVLNVEVVSGYNKNGADGVGKWGR